MMMRISSTRCTLALLVLFTLNNGLLGDMNTSIQVDQYGDVFHCVDINMQPTLKHPLLKNHKIQMEPSSFPINMGGKPTPITHSESILTSIRCPPGKIPIKRNHRQNYFMNNETKLLRWKLHDEHFGPKEEIYTYSTGYVAHMRVNGIKGSITVYEPKVNLENDPTGVGTSSMVSLANFNQTEYLATGWSVTPASDKDNHTRFHIAWMSDSKECMDHSCPGFVQVSSVVALGSRLKLVSIYGGPQYQITLMLFKDPKTRNWWLVLGENLVPIGYWPKSMFKYLDIGEQVFWGGNVKGPPSIPSSPMGSGHFPSEGYGKAAFVTKAQIVNEHNLLLTPDVKSLFYMDCPPKCYQQGEAKVGKGGFFFYFGGPGGCPGGLTCTECTSDLEIYILSQAPVPQVFRNNKIKSVWTV